VCSKKTLVLKNNHRQKGAQTVFSKQPRMGRNIITMGVAHRKKTGIPSKALIGLNPSINKNYYALSGLILIQNKKTIEVGYCLT
jgi:hypothetical protein